MQLLKPNLASSPANPQKRIDDDQWIGQRKFDGVRLLVHIDEGKIVPVNRSGTVIPLPTGLKEPFSVFDDASCFAFDGELVNGVMHVFDMPIAGMAVQPTMPYEHRLSVLEQFHARWNPGPNVKLVNTAWGTDDKKKLQAELETSCAEGMMLKKITGTYRSGVRSDDIVKFKFWKSAEVILIETGREGKDNAAMALVAPDRTLVEVGTISALGKKVEIGDVWEVKFLYVVDRAKPRLVQPSLLRKRTDKGLAECTLDQLDNCYTNKAV